MDPNSPLTPQHLNDINQALQVIQIAKAQADLAQRAGLDVAQQVADLRQAEQRLLQVKNVYFPGQ